MPDLSASDKEVHQLRLWFNEGPSIELAKTEFSSPLLPEPRICSRVKNHRTVGMTGSFSWSSAVKAMCLLFAEHKFVGAESKKNTYQISVSGTRGSLAAALDAALAKQPTWILDVFGIDPKGNSLLRRLVTRDNPEIKRPGPVTVFLKSNLLASIRVSLYVNERELKETEDIKRLVTHLQEEGPPPANRKLPISKVASSKLSTAPTVPSGPLISSPSYSYWQARLVGDLISEAAKVLAGTRRPLLQQNTFTLRALQKNKVLNRYLGKREWDLFLPLDEKESLDTSTAAMVIKDFVQRRGRALTFGTSTGSLGTLAIFTYLRSVFGIPIEIQYDFPNTQALVDHIGSKGTSCHLDGCNFSAACASRFISEYGTLTFGPIMLLPHTSHQVVSRKPIQNLRQLREARNIYITNSLSTSHLFLGEVVGDPLGLSNSMSTHQELAPALLGEEPANAAILWFPHYHLNVLFNNLLASDILPMNEGSDSNILFLHNELRLNKRLGEAVRALLRAAWSILASNRAILELTLRPVLEDSQFMAFFEESCGLSNYRYSDILLGPSVASPLQRRS